MFLSYTGLWAALLMTSGADPSVITQHPKQERRLVPVDVDFAFSELSALQQVSLAIFQDGEVARYIPFEDADTNEPINEIMSITKSVTSLLAGIAAEDNVIGPLGESVSVRFPSLRQTPYANVSLCEVLQQRSCFELPADLSQKERWKIGGRDTFRLLSMVQPSCSDGEAFFYSNIMPNVVSQVIESATGKSMDRYAERKLFEPMGIKNWRWYHDESGHTIAEAGLALSALDLAKIGQLILQEGVWQGKSILPERFIKELYRPSTNKSDYSLLWWLHRENADSSDTSIEPILLLQGSGYAGQYLYIDPLRRRVTAILTRPKWAWDLCADKDPGECYKDYVALAEQQQPMVDRIINAF